nr:unnamed protein product [Digitaria exilis]
MQRNEPGWFVGEQRHVSFFLPVLGPAADLGPLLTPPAAAAAAREGEQGAEAMFVAVAVVCAAHDASKVFDCSSSREGGRLLLYARPGEDSARACEAIRPSLPTRVKEACSISSVKFRA